MFAHWHSGVLNALGPSCAGSSWPWALTDFSQLQAGTPAPSAATQRVPASAIRPLAAPLQLHSGLLPQGVVRPAPKATFRPAALRLDEQGREVDEFGNLVHTRAESVTTLKVLTQCHVGCSVSQGVPVFGLQALLCIHKQ